MAVQSAQPAPSAVRPTRAITRNYAQPRQEIPIRSVDIHSRQGAQLRKGICCAASFKAENSFVGTSHWLLTWTALRHDEDPALFPGGGEDRYRRGGPSEGKSHASGRRVQGGVSRPGLSTVACARPGAAVPR